jgi:predicted DNA-binding protein
MISEFLSKLNLRIPEDLRQRLENLASDNDKTISQVCRELLHRGTEQEHESTN